PAFELSVLVSLGNELTRMDDFDGAIECLRQAADLTEEVADPEHMGAIYWSLSQAYSGGSRGDPGQARSYAYRAIAAYEQAENRRLIGQTFNRLGRAYAQSGQVDEALGQLRAAHDMAVAQHDARGVAEAQRSLAMVYLREQRIDEAAQAAQTALERAEGTGDARQRADSLLVFAQVQEQRGDASAAERNFSQAIELLRDAEPTERLREAYAQFSEFLERHGESKRAYEMLKNAYHSSGRGV
ncbi:MAG: tetratricopeptide repeat protein, partial [Ktedonobacterales bacterium]